MDVFTKYYLQALRFLGYRPRTEKEIRDNLKKKKIPLSLLEEIILRLSEEKLIDDLVFAKWFIEQRMKYKPRSRGILLLELGQKGVTKETAQKALEQFFMENEDLNEVKVAQELMLKRKKRYQTLDPLEQKKKLVSFLQRRGFSWETIKKVLTI